MSKFYVFKTSPKSSEQVQKKKKPSAEKKKRMTKLIIVLLLAVCIGAVHGQTMCRFGYSEALSGRFAALGQAQREGVLLWQKQVNTEQGGILVAEDGSRCQIEIVLVDNESDKDILTSQYADWLASDSIDFLIGPYSSTLSLVARDLAESFGKLLILGSAAAESIYVVENQYTFGVITPSQGYWKSLLKSLSLQGASRVGWIAEQASFTLDACAGVSKWAVLFGMELVASEVIESADVTAGGDVLEARVVEAMDAMAAANADVVLGCTYDVVPPLAVRAAKAANFAPGALGFTVAVGSQSFADEVGHDVRYLIGPLQWSRALLTIGEDVFVTAERFAQLYEAEYGIEPVYQAADGAAVGILFQSAIERVRSLDTDAVRAMIIRLNLETYFSTISVDERGANSAKPMAGMQYDENTDIQLVAPEIDAQTLLVFPMPTWDERVYVDDWYEHGSEIAMTTLAAILIAVCLAAAVFVFAKRRHPVLVASSAPFLIVFLLGACLVLTSIFLWQLYATDAACALLPWFLGIGFTLFFGALALRTYRIARIFSRVKNSTRVVAVTNTHLALMHGALLLYDVVVLAVWSGVASLRAVVVTTDPLRPSENYTECQQPSDVSIWAFLGLLLGKQLAVIIAGIVASFMIRNLKRVVYNETRALSFSMYNLLLFGVLVVVLNATADSNDRELLFIITSLAILFAVGITVAAILLPKFVYMRKGKEFYDGSASTTGGIISVLAQSTNRSTPHSQSS
jgi:branched-chain amino acid transport system substrate-binding protein